MAFVIVSLFTPRRNSQLARILAHHTKMPGIGGFDGDANPGESRLRKSSERGPSN
jgi:hypothetical protein